MPETGAEHATAMAEEQPDGRVPEVPDPVPAVDDSPAKNTRGAAERAGAGAADQEARAAAAREMVQVLTAHAEGCTCCHGPCSGGAARGCAGADPAPPGNGLPDPGGDVRQGEPGEGVRSRSLQACSNRAAR